MTNTLPKDRGLFYGLYSPIEKEYVCDGNCRNCDRYGFDEFLDFFNEEDLYDTFYGWYEEKDDLFEVFVKDPYNLETFLDNEGFYKWMKGECLSGRFN